MRIENLNTLHSQFPDIDGFWELKDLVRTEEKIRALLPPAPEVWTPENLEVLTQFGRLQGMLGQTGPARVTLEKALKLIAEIPGPARTRPEIRCLLELGRVLCLSMIPVRARDHLARAWELCADGKNTFFAIDVALVLSISETPKSQNEWLQKALALADNSSDEQARLWLAQLYTMDGLHKFEVRLFDKALESFEKALKRPRIKGDEAKHFVTRWSHARALRACNRTEESLAEQQALLEQSTQTGTPISGHIYLELAECMQALQKHPEAKTYFEFAYKALSADAWYSDNRASELARIQYLSKKR